MLIKRFYDDNLALASYLVGCQATGDALVIDANREVDQFIEAAEGEGLRISAVTETHIHADYVSGSRELAARTGARLYLSDEGGPDWKYAFAEEAGAELVRNEDSFKVGNVRIDVMHTPGHTPEHLSFVVTDTAGADGPMGVFTGDFVFVGDVGRPDLLERAAGVSNTMEDGARVVFESLQRFKALPDHLQVWPGHGAGSACGKALGAVPSTTVGYERRYNWAFQIDDEGEFVQTVLAGQPEPPRYFAQMKRINKEGPRILGGFERPERLGAPRLAEVLAQGAMVVDTRRAEDFARGHVVGTVNIPLGRTFTSWAGWLVPYDAPLYLLMGGEEPETALDEAIARLHTIGLDEVQGYFGPHALQSWEVVTGEPLQRVERIRPEEFAKRFKNVEPTILDVRGEAEWVEGHIPGARHIPLGYLEERLHELPEWPVVVHCQGGGRSAIAASLLKARGFNEVYDLEGGLARWRELKRPIIREALA